MVATARITLVQETGEQFEFLILKPVYKSGTPHETVEQRRKHLTGFAVGVFRIGDMVEAALEEPPEGIFNIQLVDEAAPAGERPLYLHQARDSDNITDEVQLKARGELFLRKPLQVPGRQWSILITPTSDWLGYHLLWKAWGVLAGGLLITVLIVAYLISVINHWEDANRQLLKTQDQLIRAEKLAAIGQMAGSVAHDIRNPLGVVKNAAYYLRRKLSGSEVAQANPRIGQFLQIIDQEVEHSNRVITGLMNFARVNAPSLAPTNLVQVIESALSGAEVSENVRVATRFDPDLPEVLALSDTGVGISRENMERLFDPLFTTKSNGTGLGLAICQQIVSSHGGTIQVISEPGAGATFIVRLPLDSNGS